MSQLSPEHQESRTLRELNVHTSDRIGFKRCRRRWHWSSPLRLTLRPKEQRRPLWFGTGWHFILEDFHGNRLYSDMVEAWRDYVQATFAYFGESNMPDNWRDLLELGEGMARYYEIWLVGRDPMQTYYVDGVPQVEVNFKIPLPVSEETLRLHNVDVVYYNGTLDRVLVTPLSALAIAEYKSAAQIFQAHYLIDPQITSYSWGAQILYDNQIDGVYYYQFKKDIPEEPRFLSTTGKFSTNKTMATTHRMYRAALINTYGEVERAPADNIDFLNYLCSRENSDGDKFIQRDYIARNQHSLESEGVKIMLEVEDMLNPNIALYPNPTRECVQMRCDFYDPCVALDDGDDWEDILQQEYIQTSEIGRDPWRQLLHKHKPYKELALDQPPPNLLQAAGIAEQIRTDPAAWLHHKGRLQLGLQ